MADGHGSDVNIKISAETSQAEGAVKRLKTAFSDVASGFRAFTKALGAVGFAIHGIQAVVDAFKTFHEWVTKGGEAAKQMRRELEQTRYERGVENAAKAYNKLNAEIERTIKLEKERAAIKARRTSDRRDAEDARQELAKQKEIAALDPASEDYGKRKREIEDRYAAKAADTAAARSKEDRGAEAEGLRKDLAAKERQIAGQKASRDADLREADAAKREIEQRKKGREWLNAMGPLGGDKREENEERIKTLEKREKAARSRAESKTEAIQAAEDAAVILREKIEVVVGGGRGADARDEAAKLAIAQGARERAAAEKKKADAQQLELAKQKEINEPEISDPQYEKKRKEIERKYAYQEAERADTDEERKSKKLAIDNEARADEREEKRKTESQRLELAKQEKIRALDIYDPDYEKKRKQIERDHAYEAAGLADSEEEREAKQLAVVNEIAAEEAAKHQQNRESFAERMAATEGVSQNRLTALGLGSGVEGRSGIAGDVKKIVDLLREEIAAVKDNKPERTDGVAIVGE